ncbi:MAG: hypothetical protein IT379_11490 [Deltaproteobacteria bacterium]|nr:hypothetical protein [Deltaproteobacteria bacterium]
MRKYVVVGTVVAVFLGTLFIAHTEAQRRRGRRGRGQPAAAAQQADPPRSAEIAKVLGELRWGMNKQQVTEHFLKKTRERFRPELAKARGAVEEDRTRRRMDAELAKVRRGYTEFREGVTTGWEASFLRDEFTAGNEEGMLAVTDENSQNFYFFIQGRLWKWYKAFDARVFAGMNFDQFAQTVQGRFGEGRRQTGELVAGRGRTSWLEWQDDTSRLRAIDQTRFYGFYCLVFEERATLARLEQLRPNRPTRRTGPSVVDMVTQDDGARTSDEDIADRITGKIRRRADAEDAGVRGTSSGGRTGTGGGTGTSRPPDSDPLRGLEL